MDLQNFIARWSGKNVDTDGVYPNQCMDLMHQYCIDVYGFAPNALSAPAAKDVYLNFPNLLGEDRFDRIPNTLNNIPEPGDIIFWDIGEYGHVAIFVQGNLTSFTSFDANWPLGSLPHIQGHSYSNVLGWLRFKKPIIQPFAQPIINQDPMQYIDDIITNKTNEFKIDGDPTVYQIFHIPSPEFLTNVLKDDFNNIITLPSDFSPHPQDWVNKVNDLKIDVQSLQKQLSDVSTANTLALQAGQNQLDSLNNQLDTVKQKNSDLVANFQDLQTKLAALQKSDTPESTTPVDTTPTGTNTQPQDNSSVQPIVNRYTGILGFIANFIAKFITFK